MNEFLNLTKEQRRIVFNETSSRIHLPIIAVEKDFWVTEVLKMIFTLPYADKAILDDNLWETIRHHREVFTSIRNVDYTPDVRKRINLIPPNEVIDTWKDDYDTMVCNMIYDDSKPSFDDIIKSAKEIQNMFKHYSS